MSVSAMLLRYAQCHNELRHRTSQCYASDTSQCCLQVRRLQMYKKKAVRDKDGKLIYQARVLMSPDAR